MRPTDLYGFKDEDEQGSNLNLQTCSSLSHVKHYCSLAIFSNLRDPPDLLAFSKGFS